jgi:alanine-synthesizing transaminase
MSKAVELEAIAERAGLRGGFGLGSPNIMPPFLALARFIFELLNFVCRKHGYAPRSGEDELRLALAERYNEQYGAQLPIETVKRGGVEVRIPPNIAIFEGTRGGGVEVLRDYVGVVVLPTVYYPGHLHAIEEAGSVPFFVPMPTVGQYLSSIRQKMESDRTFRPTVVILSFDNPLWLRRTQKDYEAALQLYYDYGCVILSDEAYSELVFCGIRTESIMRVPGWINGAIVLKSLSKNYGLAGWKVGPVIGTVERLDRAVSRKNKRSEGGFQITQLAAATAVKWCPGFPQRKVAARYHHRSDFTIRLLMRAGITQFDFGEDSATQQGGMFLFFKPPVDSDEFLFRMAQMGFLAKPGSQFGRPGWVRWCLREPDRVTRHACKTAGQVIRGMQTELIVAKEELQVQTTH